MSMKLITAPPWIEPPMFIWSSVGNMRQMLRPGPSGLNSRRPVAAVGKPAIGLEQDRGAEEAVAVPPIARAARRAAEAQDALVKAVELRAVARRLQPLARRRRAHGLQPGLDQGILRVGVGQVGN